MIQTKDEPLATHRNPRFAAESPLSVRGVQFILSLAIVVVSVLPLARYIATALLRINYPFDLEWCEGGTLGHIRVVLAGQHIYREPSFEFTPYIYPPLYYYVSALPSLVLGAGHLAPRLVSFVSILGCFVLLGRWVRDETDDPVAGVAAIGVLASVYQLTGFWFELARVDAFFLLLVLSSHLLARTTTTPRRAALVGVLMAAACFTKQLGIPLAAPALLLLLMRSWRLAFVAAAVSGGLLLVLGLAFNISTHGWFLYYTLELPSRHQIQWERFAPSAQTFFLSSTLPMSLAGVALICGFGFARGEWKRWLFHAVFVGLAVSTSFLPFLKSGGYPNGLIPGYAALALAFGIVLAKLRDARTPLGALGPNLAACAVLGLLFAALDYDPKTSLPSTADLDGNKEVMARLAALPKPLFVTGSSFYTMTAGDQPIMADTMALIDIFKGGGVQSQNLRKVMLDAFREHRFNTIVVDRVIGFLPDDITNEMRKDYAPSGTVLHGLPADVIWQKSGASLRPDGIWRPR